MPRRRGLSVAAPERSPSDLPSPWIVLKFGGTSVSTLSNWTNIARIVRERRATGARVLIVHSAISGITDRLERLLDAAIGQAQEEELRAIEERHRALAHDLSVPLGEEVERHFAELGEIAAGVALVGEVSERSRARVMATGELMATHIGARFLKAQGLEVAWTDARGMLRAERPGRRSGAPASCRLPAISPPMPPWRRSSQDCRRSSSRRASSPATMRATRCSSGAAARTPLPPI